MVAQGFTALKFQISDDVFDHLLKDSMRYFYFQRTGMDLAPEYAGKFAHKAFFSSEDFDPVNHDENEFKTPLESDPSVLIDVHKGWFDAGDFGKYMRSASTAVKQLLFAYEDSPQVFHDSQNNIPESGNQIPDILDEARYELDFMRSMQDPSDGGFYSTVYGNNTNPFSTDQSVRDQFK